MKEKNQACTINHTRKNKLYNKEHPPQNEEKNGRLKAKYKHEFPRPLKIKI